MVEIKRKWWVYPKIEMMQMKWAGPKSKMLQIQCTEGVYDYTKSNKQKFNNLKMGKSSSIGRRVEINFKTFK